MKAHVYTFTLFVLILSLSTTPLRAQEQGQTSSVGYPAPEPAIEITDMRLLGAATKGATVTLQVRFRAHVDGPSSIMLRYPKHVAPPGRRPEETFRTKSLQLKNGEEYVKTYPMRVEDTGGAMVSAIVRAEEVPEGFDANDSEHVNVVSGTDTYQVFAPGDTTRRRVTATKGTTGEAQAKSQSFYTVSVSGKIDFFDEDPYQLRMEGLYGSEVELWFRDSSTPNQLYHPVLGDTEHTHYDDVEEDGQYHFNFSFSGDLSGYDELLVLVQTSNDAASMSVGQGAWIIDSGSGTETFFGPQQGVAYDISGMGTTISISNADAEVNSKDGAILRNMKLAREFVEARYGGSVPFNLPITPVSREDLPPNKAGIFTCSEDFITGNETFLIKIDHASTDISTVTHEYGHFVHYKMWGDCTTDNNVGGPPAYDDASDQVAEGWAISFSFGARNYANEAFGDALRKNDDNTEEDAFDESPYRFQGIRYADGGNPSFAAFACYLWSLYDNYSGGPFEVTLYDDGDNEDVSGYANEVFEVFRNEEETTASGYNGAFKSGLSSEAQTSVQSIYDFMTSDLTSVPSTPMRPAQLTNASGQIQSNGNVEFQWSQRTYPTGRDYGTYPAGYRLYQGDQSVATVPFGTTSYTYSPGGENSENYKLSAYNSEGEAQAAPVLDLLDITTLSGPTVLDEGEQGTWTASASRSGASFTWFADEGFGGYQIGTGSSVTRSWGSISSTITVDIKVEASKGHETASAQLPVIINNTNGDPGCDTPARNRICLAVDRKSLIVQNVRAEAQTNRTAHVSWQAGGSDVPSAFVVQHRTDSTAAWSTLGTVSAEDSSSVDSSQGRRLSAYRFRTDELEIGTHQFRVGLPEGTGAGPRAVGTDDAGSSQRFAGPVTAKIAMEEAYRLSTYPNPVRQQATVELAVKERQEVAVRLYDVLGRRVATLHSGPMPAQELRRLRLDVSATGLTSGTYFLRVRGEDFAATEQITVVR